MRHLFTEDYNNEGAEYSRLYAEARSIVDGMNKTVGLKPDEKADLVAFMLAL